MTTQFIQKFPNLSFIRNLPDDAGIGMVGGLPYVNGGSGPTPLTAGMALAGAQVVNPAGVLFINNRTEQENPGTAAYAVNGRPD